MAYTSILLRACTLMFVLGVFCSVPALVSAYTTSAQGAESLPDGIVFTIDYSFSNKTHAITLPMIAERSNTHTSSTLSYTILDQNGNEVSGTVAGIVISNASITKNGMYEVSKNSRKNFRLYGVFIPQTHNTDTQYRLQVTNLPFFFDEDQALQLNPSELQYYTTPLQGL